MLDEVDASAAAPCSGRDTIDERQLHLGEPSAACVIERTLTCQIRPLGSEGRKRRNALRPWASVSARGG